MIDLWDSFKDAKMAKSLVDLIHNTVYDKKEIKIMEVCGTHTQAIFRYGIRGLLPKNIDIISGPGCPVCVTPNRFIDYLVAFSKRNDVIVVVFGDMLKVPGSSSSLLKERSSGAEVRIVYSPLDAVEIAENEKNKKIIFGGIGFETTVPAIAASVLEAEKRNIKNYYVLTAMKVLPPALTTLLSSDKILINGLILPGHVSAIIGSNVYQFIVDDYSVGGVIAGFEPIDVLMAIFKLSKMITEKKPSIENLYTRVVKSEGNEKAQKIIYDVFELCDSEWRGIGEIKNSGLCLKKEFIHRDPVATIPVEVEELLENPKCICGEILCGIKKPVQCPLFKKVCTPENPVGSCMVSNEGTCAAYYKYFDINIP